MLLKVLPVNDLGLGLGDILRPEFISPLINDLPVEQQLASYLPEVCKFDIHY